jgi:hypothetical protein
VVLSAMSCRRNAEEIWDLVFLVLATFAVECSP